MTLADSFAECRRITAAAKSSFPLAFRLLPQEQRRGMTALYAWMRVTDDIADGDDANKSEQLQEWRTLLKETRPLGSEECSLTVASLKIMPAVHDMIARYQMPLVYFHAVLDGVASDLQPQTFPAFDELKIYCERVASAVGLCCLRIWGVTDEAATQPAIDAGIAFQLTNILRDVKEDYDAGRFYLPQTEAAWPPSLAQLQLQIARAHDYYLRSRALHAFLPRRPRAMFRTMSGIYEALLNEIERRPQAVLERRLRVAGWRKLAILCLSSI